MFIVCKMERILNGVYNSPSSSAYLAGINTVYRVAKKQYPKLTVQNVRDFLSHQNEYTLHKPLRKRFPRNKVVASGLDSDWQVDLIDVLPLKKFNKGFSYIVACIDVFSRYAWAIPIKNKKPSTVLEAFKEILRSGRKPFRLVSDGGTEFRAGFHQYMKDNEITHWVATSDDVKACNIERWIRTLKTRLWRHFTKAKTFSYLTILPKLVASINNTVCRVTKHTPADVTIANENVVRSILKGSPRPAMPKFLYKAGDFVRISKNKTKLTKGYKPNYTEEVFVVSECLNRHPATYRLKDQDGEPISGIFYTMELSRCPKVYKRAHQPARRR